MLKIYDRITGLIGYLVFFIFNEGSKIIEIIDFIAEKISDKNYKILGLYYEGTLNALAYKDTTGEVNSFKIAIRYYLTGYSPYPKKGLYI